METKTFLLTFNHKTQMQSIEHTFGITQEMKLELMKNLDTGERNLADILVERIAEGKISPAVQMFLMAVGAVTFWNRALDGYRLTHYDPADFDVEADEYGPED